MKVLINTLLILLLTITSSNVYAYCVQWNLAGQCVQQDQYSQEKQQREKNNIYIKPLPVIPPVGTNNCNWILINGQWSSICN